MCTKLYMYLCLNFVSIFVKLVSLPGLRPGQPPLSRGGVRDPRVLRVRRHLDGGRGRRVPGAIPRDILLPGYSHTLPFGIKNCT